MKQSVLIALFFSGMASIAALLIGFEHISEIAYLETRIRITQDLLNDLIADKEERENHANLNGDVYDN